MKKLFKKQSLIDTAVNLAIGGGANVAMDYAVDKIEALKTLDASTVNFIKIGVGVLGGTMVSNKYVRAGLDGLATVGVSNLIKGYVTPTSGVPFIGTGRVRAGQRGFRRVNGTGTLAGASFMSK